ncbi:MAG: hypothetical protein ACHQJ6_01035 [Candidatus Berkiellales bacterium]
MKNRYRLAAAIVAGLLISANVHAKWQKNFLLGVSGGYARSTGEYNIDLQYTGVPFFPDTFFSQGYRDHGPMWGLLAGYQASCEEWIFGGELNVDWYDMDYDRLFLFSDLFEARIWDAKQRYEHQPTVGLSARIGYKMAPYFISYIRLGIETSRDRLISTFSGTPTINMITVEAKQRRQEYHWVAGIGGETPFCFLNMMPLSLRLEYNVHVPGTTLANTVVMEDGLINPQFISDTKPKNQVLKASLVWNIPV